jgi:hypothetical protein
MRQTIGQVVHERVSGIGIAIADVP